MSRPAVLCVECRVYSDGTRMNHCPGCHHTFSGVRAFDRHLDVDYKREPAVRHRDPADVGLLWNQKLGWARSR